MSAARKLIDPYLDCEDDIAPVRAEPKRKQKHGRVPTTLKICVVAACCVMVALLYLQQQVVAYHLNFELVQLQEQVNVGQQRNDHLMLSLESQRSLKQIEHIARTKLGMVDPVKTSIIVVNQETVRTVQGESRWFDVEPSEGVSSGVFATLASWLNKVLPLGGVEAGTLQR